MDLPPELEKTLADLDEGAWAAFVARVRAPDTAESFRDVASKYIDGDRLESICKVANISQFVGKDGQIDAAKVERSLRAVFGIPAGPKHSDFGQFSPLPDIGGAGDGGTAEARKRFSGQQSPPLRGRGGYDEAVRRGYVTGGTETPAGGN